VVRRWVLAKAGVVGKAVLLSGICVLPVEGALPQSKEADARMSFDLYIELSAKAAAKLKRTGEGIIIRAAYYGNPTRAAEKHANEMGTLDLASETNALPGVAGRVHVSGKGISAKNLGMIKGSAMVNVSVYSARKASADNILNCDFIDAAVQRVTRAPVTLKCSLIEEGLETNARP
jgi:hypothetical protein